MQKCKFYLDNIRQSTHFDVFIQNSTDDTDATLCASYNTDPPAMSINLQCGSIWGQYLRIKKNLLSCAGS